MGVKTQDIYDLIDRFVAADITRLKLSWDGCELELEKGAAMPAPVQAPVIVAGMPAPAAVPAAPVAAASPVAAAADGVSAAPAAPAAEDTRPAITAPLVGTFYLAPAPDKDPYVQVGDHVKKGDTVCLLEAMKMMSEVTAPCDCVIEEIVASDGELVSFGDPLIRYREA